MVKLINTSQNILIINKSIINNYQHIIYLNHTKFDNYYITLNVHMYIKRNVYEIKIEYIFKFNDI